MDKVKQILEQLRKYHFWILCVVAAIVGLIAWSMSSGKLDAEFRASAGKIDADLKKLEGISVDQPHTNWKDSTEKESKVAEKSVKSARDTIYKQQKDEVFTWPQELGGDFL